MADTDARIAALEKRCQRLTMLAAIAGLAAAAALVLNILGKLNKTLAVDEIVVGKGTTITDGALTLESGTSAVKIMPGRIYLDTTNLKDTHHAVLSGAAITLGRPGEASFVELNQLFPSVGVGTQTQQIYLVPKHAEEPPHIDFHLGDAKKSLP